MQKRLSELQYERGRLLERIAGQRRELVLHSAPLARAFQWGDKVNGAVQTGKDLARNHPLAVSLLAAVIFVLKPRAVLGVAGRGMGLWRNWKALQAVLPEGLLGRLLGLL